MEISSSPPLGAGGSFAGAGGAGSAFGGAPNLSTSASSAALSMPIKCIMFESAAGSSATPATEEPKSAATMSIIAITLPNLIRLLFRSSAANSSSFP